MYTVRRRNITRGGSSKRRTGVDDSSGIRDLKPGTGLSVCAPLFGGTPGTALPDMAVPGSTGACQAPLPPALRLCSESPATACDCVGDCAARAGPHPAPAAAPPPAAASTCRGPALRGAVSPAAAHPAAALARPMTTARRRPQPTATVAAPASAPYSLTGPALRGERNTASSQLSANPADAHRCLPERLSSPLSTRA